MRGALLDHFPQVTLDEVGFRGRLMRKFVSEIVSDLDPKRSNRSGPNSAVAQYVVDQGASGGFAGRARDADGMQLLTRMTVELGRHRSQRRAAIGHDELWQAGLNQALHQQRRGPVSVRLLDEV